MKKIKYAAAIFAVVIALLMSVDESISFYANITATHIPLHSGNTDLSHHHTISFSDHFFQKNYNLFLSAVQSTDLDSYLKPQPEFSSFLSSIWQPPKRSC